MEAGIDCRGVNSTAENYCATHLGPIFVRIHFIYDGERISGALVSFKCQMYCVYDIIHHQPVHVINSVTCKCTFETTIQCGIVIGFNALHSTSSAFSIHISHPHAKNGNLNQITSSSVLLWFVNLLPFVLFVLLMLPSAQTSLLFYRLYQNKM